MIPLAIVGQSCLLPGANSPAELFEQLSGNRVVVRSSPPGRFALAPEHALSRDPSKSVDRAWSDRGGYVEGFAFDPSGFRVPADALGTLDPLFHWALHTGREALGNTDPTRTGVVLGNLSFPTSGMAAHAESEWLKGTPFARPAVDPRNRFMSGLPAHVLARALGLGGEAFALDAACASSLYAIALAGEALRSGRADAMLAGAVCRADDLFIHVGFCALGAMSKTGRSRPFTADADGLVPAEGAVMFLLKRLDDAERAGDSILGVIRSVGLSNDGRGRGLVAPSSDGQVRAIRAAYARARLSPDDVSYVECHATGTQVGDAAELQSLRTVFGARGLPIGSIKANMGHALTVAGAAGLMKLLHALREERHLPTPVEGALHGSLDDGAFRVVRSAEAWQGPRRAALDAFGFGGNNAHLIVEAHREPRVHASAAVSRPRIGVVAMATRVGNGKDVHDLARALQGGDYSPRASEVEVPLTGLRTPPKDLQHALAQHTAFLATACDAARGIELPANTMIVAGMGADSEVARYGARWRMAEYGSALPAERREAARDAFTASLKAEGVLGTMPNVVANRVNAQLDAQGPSFSVSGEELSGLRALRVAADALANGSVDAAVVGAVDFSCEPVHEAARAAFGACPPAGDAAVVLILEREEDAARNGHPVLAWLDSAQAPQATIGSDAIDPTTRLGRAHAATGIVQCAAAIVALCSGELSCVDVRCDALLGVTDTIRLERGGGTPRVVPANGPSLSLPAHPPAVTLPENLRMQTMEPAPKLVPVLESSEAATPTPAAVVRHEAAPNGPLAEILHRVQEQQRRIGEVHRAFLAQQAETHAQFLEMRARVASPLLNAPAVAHAPALALAPAPAPALAPAPAPAPAPVTTGNVVFHPKGPTFDRKALEVHASGKISEIFGEVFQQQDQYTVQVRMPAPPLLLADRCTGIDTTPGKLGTGRIWTETDVKADAFYMHAGRMTPGVMIESGQADLMLVSYQGIDFLNKGQRAYRLLGCNLTFHDSPPKAGETLSYEIHADAHANQGDVRLFFFHYDCHVGGRRALSVREGQAGFFTTEELANSAGILWSAETHVPEKLVSEGGSARLDPPRVNCTRSSFSREQLEAFADRGDALECFGPGFERAGTHTRTPSIPGGQMLFFDRVTQFDPHGGPWKRGYLRAVQDVSPDDWFFSGHFVNDPCMPGTLMFDGCLATMAFYLAAMGLTLNNDGYRFEPITGEEYKLKCRGQVTPTSKELVYEVFVEEVHDGDEVRLYADLLCTVDGLPAFHARRMGLRLVPDWPLTSMKPIPADPKPVAVLDGLPLDYRSLLACAWGQPSTAFGPRYATFDGPRRVPRLPGPPYHYVTRVVKFEGEPFVPKVGSGVEFEYDVPPDAWYFEEGGCGAMPFSVLLEAALQPCGWLASFVGSTLTTKEDLAFRNLDGKGVIHAEVLPNAGVLRTKVKITNISPAAGMLIESFEIECTVGDQKIFTGTSVFGFFPPAALASQVGLPTSDTQRAQFDSASEFQLDLRDEPARYRGSSARLAGPMLRMIDRVTAFDPKGGAHGHGFVRAEMDIDPRAWFFKAHFFQDPVQPGSLGIEAMRQTLAFAMLELGLDEGIAAPRFLPLESRKNVEGSSPAPDLIWKYRGQVVPENAKVTVTMDLVELGRDTRGSYARCEASLWVDGKRIYEARGMGLRIVPGPSQLPEDEELDVAKDAWVKDHCPTFTVPALPMMSMVDRLAAAAGASTPFSLRDVQVHRWVTVDPAARLRTEVRGDSVELSVFRTARDPRLSRFERAASAIFERGAPAAASLPPLHDATPTDDPYASGELFHGPSFQLLLRRSIGSNGAEGVLDAGRGSVPYGALHQALLDAATHVLPHDRLHVFDPRIAEDRVGYPYRIPHLHVYAPLPSQGEVQVDARFVGFEGDDARFPAFELQLSRDGQILVQLRLVEILMPKGPIGRASPADRAAFLRDRRFVPGLGLSDHHDGETILSDSRVAESDWLPGTIQKLYGAAEDRTKAIAVAEHIAARAHVHPSLVDADRAVVRTHPLLGHPLEVERRGNVVHVKNRGPAHLELAAVRAFWAERFGLSRWPVEDMCFGLIERFVEDVTVEDPAAHAAIHGQSVMYLANHQTGIESILFSVLASALQGVTTMTLAKAEHRESWIGQLLQLWFTYPGAHDPGVIAHFDRKDAASLLTILEDLGRTMRAGKSLLVHVEGTRARSARARTANMSGAFVDLALAVGTPIVPVRFTGGLPVEEASERLEFPVGFGKQRYHLGRPLLPSELSKLTYRARTERILEAINALGEPPETERPTAGDPAFAAKVAAHAAKQGVSVPHATIREVLAELSEPCAETKQLLADALDAHAPEFLRTLARWLGEGGS